MRARDAPTIACTGQFPRPAIAVNEPADHKEAALVRRFRDHARQWMSPLRRSTRSLPGPPSAETSRGTWARIARRSMRFGVALGLVLTVIWGLTDVVYYWPGWIWFALALPVTANWTLRRAMRTTARRALAVHAAIALVIALALIAIWLLSSHRYFWPIWPILGLVLILAGHGLLVPSESTSREQILAERVDVLTRTRKDALDVQVAEMRRVERDLHDGAQARLVSLGMSLGMADELVDSDPDAARRLLAEARTAAGDALGDLRAVVRGILPPVLADRGLVGALHALVLASPVPVEISAELPTERLPAPVESAAYFAVAEAIANVIKHSGARTAWIRVRLVDGLLSMLVGDDGFGGADPDKGSGLRGIEHRLEAFDGTMQISSPSGGPTVVTMEVPCAR
jgi:signal transduction histidine kinase